MNRYTSHSITRCQQRGVKAEVADFVVAYGDFTRTHQDRKFFIMIISSSIRCDALGAAGSRCTTREGLAGENDPGKPNRRRNRIPLRCQGLWTDRFEAW